MGFRFALTSVLGLFMVGCVGPRPTAPDEPADPAQKTAPIRMCLVNHSTAGQERTRSVHRFVSGMRTDESFSLVDPAFGQDSYLPLESFTAQYQHDVSGRPIRIERQGRRDGTQLARFTYDAAGRLVRFAESGVGSTQETTWAFDRWGRLLRRTLTMPGVTLSLERLHDDAGRLLLERELVGERETRSMIWRYGAQGPVETLERKERGPGVDAATRVTFEYSPSGRLVAQQVVEDFDGAGQSWDRATRRLLDVQGRPTLIEVDHPIGGATDERQELAYDGTSERRTFERQTWVSSPGGPKVQWEYTRRFDAAGRLLEQTSSADAQRERREYDAAGRLLSVVTETLAGQLRERRRLSYDGAGRETVVERDTGSGFVVVSRRAYGASGQLVRHEAFDGGAAPAEVTTYSDGCYDDILRADEITAKALTLGRTQ